MAEWTNAAVSKTAVASRRPEVRILPLPNMKKIAIIGYGKIGRAVVEEAEKMKWKIEYVLRSGGVYRKGNRIAPLDDYKKTVHGIDAVMLCIPTLDDGKIAADYILHFAKKKIPVVTCEKGSLANYYSSLEPCIDTIGASATVGGGTRMLRYLKERNPKYITEAQAVINGTLNFIFSGVAAGKNIDKITEEAIRRGFTESGVSGIVEVANSELNDVLLKSVILFNLSGLSGKILKARDIFLKPVGAKDIKKIVAEKRRCVFSIDKDNAGKSIGGFQMKIGGWNISAGFKKISGDWLPDGVNNALLIKESNDEYLLQGPGAGPVPTARSMIRDMQKILRLP